LPFNRKTRKSKLQTSNYLLIVNWRRGGDFSTNLPVKNHAQQTGNVSQREITKEKWEWER
jgi:hypothetical protein